MIALVAICLAALPAISGVPKLLILEHYPDYFG
jgi:hypothetical protein